MNKIRCYLKDGWTIREWDPDEGHVAYWITAPNGEGLCGFPTKKEARAYWTRNARRMRRNHSRDLLSHTEGCKLAQECGLDWNDLDEFEKDMWARAARDMK